MCYARRVLAVFVYLMVFLALPTYALNLHPTTQSSGLVGATKSIHAEDAGIFFSGSFSYSVGGGMARMTAQTVTNPNGTASGPLRFSLWWTPNAPYPSAGGTNTAQYVITQSLGAGASVSNVDSGLTLPFTDPGNGCYYVSLVLEENVSGVWTQRDYGNFSLRISSGQGCLFSFTGSPLTISPGGSSTLTWSTGGTSVTIDNGLGGRPANSSVGVTPAATTTYTLTVNGTADGTPRTGQVTITVGPAAPTATFSASPTTIISGQSSTLTWTSTNATTVSIDNGVGSQALNGSVPVSPTTTTTYTLTATGPGGTITKTATVTVSQPAPTATFSAAPTTINLGQSSTLTWTTTNATTVSIDHGVGSEPVNGNTSVSPTSTTTYTLTVTGPGGGTTKTATVTVNVPAPTVAFSASPTTIGAGGSSTLIWNTTNAATVTIDNGVGSQPLSGSTSVHPTLTTTYTLTAVGPGGTMTGQATVTISSGPSITFSASPVFIGAGQTSTLTWSTTNATSVSIDNGVGSKPTSGTTVVSPPNSTTYTLTATGPGGTSTAQAVVVIVPLPSVLFFADTTTIAPGGSANLTWSTAGVDTVTIDHGIGPAAPFGTVKVSPSQTTTYQLTATNVAGSTNAFMTITVGAQIPPKHRAVKH